MKRYCLTLDLKNDPELIRQYEEQHKAVWPEIISSIRNAGIENMEIYRFETRLIMIIEVNGDFSFENKQVSDASDPKVQEWENMMLKYQAPAPGSASVEKWKLMKKIFELNES